jgi:hypothetical protein
MNIFVGIVLAILWVLSAFYFYYLGARNEAHWWIKRIQAGVYDNRNN